MKNHEILERNVGLLVVFMMIVVGASGLTQVVSLFFQDMVNTPIGGIKPHAVLELEGRDTYIREGYIDCRSQMVHLLRTETKHYNHHSVASESAWDHPSLWGSKHTGPDPTRVGGRCSGNWHRAHPYNPRDVVPESKMSTYPWLVENKLDGEDTVTKMEVLHKLGTPYINEDIAGAREAVKGKTEMDALVALLQGLGTSIGSKR